MNDQALLRYSRHLLLPDWSEAVQDRLGAAHVLVVGAGGLGSPASLYLAAAGVGQLTLCDHDQVDLSNLQRQIALASADVGRLKVAATAQRLHQINPEVRLHTVPRRLTEAEEGLLEGVDVVLDASDDFATRFLLNRLCLQRRLPLVSAAVIRYKAQLTVFDFRQQMTPCYACLYAPDSVEEAERCALMGVFAPLAGVVGSWQAGEALKILAGVGTPLVGRLLLIDGSDSSTRTLTLLRDPDCPVCGL